MARPVSQGESTSECLGHSLKRRVLQPLHCQAFIGFLIAYIKEGSHSLCSGLLQVITFTDSNGKDVTNYFLQINKEKMLPMQGNIGVISLVTFQSLGELAQLQKVILKICSKHLLLQLRVREFQQEQASKQPRYNAGLVSHRKANPWVWLLCGDSRLPVF